MSLPEGYCPHCGGDVTDMQMLAEEVLRGSTGECQVYRAQRTFVGTCPEHGRVFAAKKLGHHATMKEARLKRRYKGQIRDAILAQLSDEQRKRFKQVLEGRVVASTEELANWDALGGIA